MMFVKNVLLGSLSFATVLVMGNLSGAIAQNFQISQRYPTDLELDLLFTRFAKSVQLTEGNKVGLGYVRDRRTDAQKESLNSFIRSWAVVNPEIAPFLGSWQGYEDQITIYPSNTKNRVCIIGTGEGMGRFYLGNISKEKIYTNGYSILFRQGRYLGDAVVMNGEPKLLGETPHNSPRPLEQIEQFVNSRVQTQYRSQIFQKYRDAGCTSSLPILSNNQTQISTQTHPAGVVVSGFYTWYLNNSRHREILYQQKESFTPNLYRYLDRAIRITQANNQWSGMLNYDLFSFTQVGSYSFQITSVVPKENSTEVYLNLEVGLRGSRNLQPIKVIVIRNGNSWQIDNFYFLNDPSKNYNLLSELIKFNQSQMFQNVPWGNYETIPSVPSSSTPVKSTDTIAKYPTNDDFNAFEDKLQGNPESLVKLRGNQAEQRRKFQNDWKDRNPNAAKFLGAWYTGDRYFYVFPATVKGGTCVVTQDANGKLDMQVGTVLNKELRYGGGKGFFWRDRENIVASRDTGSGSLYPIYATSAMPELSESMIGDMERQKCITALPFEADAQYYKERGDKFAKLGKKDEAIANYGKALELFRKQNLFAQIRTIESLIANLGGTTKPITQKPVDTVYSGVSPLYEDVNDPAYKPDKGMTPTFRVGLNAFDIVDNGQTVNLNSKVKPDVPTIILIHGLENDPSFPGFRNLLKAVRYNSSMQVLVVDWGQGARVGLPNLGIAAARIEATASKVADLIKKYKLDPSKISLIGHSLGAHVSVDLALKLQTELGSVKSITLLDPAVDMPTGYTVKDLSSISKSTFIRAFYTSAAGSSSFAASADESYNIKYPSQTIRIPADTAHGEAMTLLANSFQGDSSRNRNCIAEQFIKLDQQFPDIPQNTTRERPSSGTKPATDLYVAYDSNKWLYPKQIVSGALDVNPEKGNCKLQSDGVRTFDSIQNILK